MYAATGVGYAASATLAGVVQSAASPSAAILAGAGLTLLLTIASASGELDPSDVNGYLPDSHLVSPPGKTNREVHPGQIQ